jgi:sugar lactone lactonase YvrE
MTSNAFKILTLAACVGVAACTGSDKNPVSDPVDEDAGAGGSGGAGGRGGSGGSRTGGSGGSASGGSGGSASGGSGGSASGGSGGSASGGSGGSAPGGSGGSGTGGAGGAGGSRADGGARPDGGTTTDGGSGPRPDGGGTTNDPSLAAALAATPEIVAKLPGFPEGPSYRPSDGSVILCADALMRVAPDGKRFKMLSFKCLGSVVLGDGSILVTGAEGLYQVLPDGKVNLLAAAPKANDLTVDKAGNVYFTADGTVHRVTPAGKHDMLGAGPANGIEVDPADQYLYVTGGTAIRRYALPPAGSALGAATDFATDLPTPDGLAFDAQGRLWVALHTVPAVGIFDPATRKDLGRIRVPIGNPAKIVQNVAFGGSQNDVLYAVGGNIAENSVLVRWNVGVKGFKTNPGAASYNAVRTLPETVTEVAIP